MNGVLLDSDVLIEPSLNLSEGEFFSPEDAKPEMQRRKARA